MICLSVNVDDITLAGKTQSMPKVCEQMQNKADLDDPVSFTDQENLGMYSTVSASQQHNCDGEAGVCFRS